MSKQPPVRIGSRASPLAQAQARQVQAAITAVLGAPAEAADEIAPITFFSTAGDRIQDRRLLEIGGKGLFTEEIEAALRAGQIDCAVHSLKDVPSSLPEGLVIAATPEREDVRDAYVSTTNARYEDLPQGARLGTASLRRQTQALFRRPDLALVNLRGNVQTRLAKLERGEADGILLAYAGLRRLGLQDVARQLFDPDEIPTAPGQGCLAIETRIEDAGSAWARALNHAPTGLAIAAERGALEALEGSCRTAVAARAVLEDGGLRLIVEALTPDGKERFRREGRLDAVTLQSADALGRRLGDEIRAEGGDRLLLKT
ncbi:MAG: hydroxymethylbilane synthase [Caulobacteraceae bacterium]